MPQVRRLTKLELEQHNAQLRLSLARTTEVVLAQRQAMLLARLHLRDNNAALAAQSLEI